MTKVTRDYYLGIDPGRSGGWALLDRDGEVRHQMSLPWKNKRLDGLKLRHDWEQFADRIEHATIERQWSRPGFGGGDGLMKGYGGLLALLDSLDIVVIEVAPTSWQSDIIPNTPKGETKQASIAYVNKRHPDVCLVQPRCKKQHDGVADAICIAHYGRRMDGLL